MCTHFAYIFPVAYNLECAKALREFTGQEGSAIQVWNKKITL